MKGWLKRQSVGLMKSSWQCRWFVLFGDHLSYYSSDDDSKPHLGRIYLPGHSLVEHPFGSQQKYIFELQREGVGAQSRSHILWAETEEERREWTKKIKEVLYGSKGGAIFGRPLELTLKYEKARNRKRKVPELVQACVEFLRVNGLDSEGLFRMPGRTALVKQLRNAFDVGERPRMDRSTMDVHSVASLLKSYLRELPSPLIPITFYDPVMHIITRELDLFPEESVVKLANVISTLPAPYYDLLRYVCRFLHEVGQRSEVNRMTEMNLATIFSQSFIEPEDDDPALLMGTADNRSKAAFILINRVDQIFAKRMEDDGAEKEKEREQSTLSCFDSKHFDVEIGENNDFAESSDRRDKTKFRDISNSDWTIIDSQCLLDGCEDFAGICIADGITKRKLHRRSMSLGDEPLMAPAEGPVGPPRRASEISSAGSCVDLESLLASDPSTLSPEEVGAHFLQMRDEFLKQQATFCVLQKELSEAKQRHAEYVKLMVNRLNEERMATSDAVKRVVEIQAKLEKYQLVYGPLL